MRVTLPKMPTARVVFLHMFCSKVYYELLVLWRVFVGCHFRSSFFIRSKLTRARIDRRAAGKIPDTASHAYGGGTTSLILDHKFTETPSRKTFQT